jgi:nicotinamidase-related amidase
MTLMDPLRYRLDRKQAALLVIDVQEKLSAVMPQEVFARTLENLVRCVEGAKLLGIPIVWTEQYVKGLGPTVDRLRSAMPEGLKPIEKLVFSSCAAPAVRESLRGRSQVMCVGMETHVCVFQTARDLEELGVRTFIVGDAVISRAKINWKLGLECLRGLGSTVTSTEMMLFDLTKTSGTEEFKAISRLVK